jgi:hypothetical protein
MTLLPRLLLSLFIVVFLYCQIFVMAAVLSWHLPNNYVSVECNKRSDVSLHIALPYISGALTIPLPEPVFLLFNGGGVFNAAATFNLDMEVKAQLQGTSADGRWITLRGYEDYFPCCSRGERWERLTLDWQKTLGAQLGLLPNDCERQSYRALSAKFIRRWNSDHAGAQIYMIWWPRGDDSYYQFFERRQYELVYRDPAVR